MFSQLKRGSAANGPQSKKALFVKFIHNKSLQLCALI